MWCTMLLPLIRWIAYCWTSFATLSRTYILIHIDAYIYHLLFLRKVLAVTRPYGAQLSNLRTIIHSRLASRYISVLYICLLSRLQTSGVYISLHVADLDRDLYPNPNP
jgi:hypothetical protein